MAIGAPNNNNFAGHVRVFQLSAGSWVQLGADIDGEGSGDLIGTSIAISSDGTIVAIGAPFKNSLNGNVRVFQYASNAWSQLGSTMSGTTASEMFGNSVSLSSDGSLVAIGAPACSTSGKGYVYVFKFETGAWSQLGAELIGKFNNEESGFSVDISSDGSIIAVGTKSSNGRAVARVHKYVSGSWVQQGSDLFGIGQSANEGWSVSI